MVLGLRRKDSAFSSQIAIDWILSGGWENFRADVSSKLEKNTQQDNTTHQSHVNLGPLSLYFQPDGHVGLPIAENQSEDQMS